MFNQGGIKRIAGHVVLDDDCRLVKRKSHPQFKHHIWVLAGLNDEVIVNILYEPFVASYLNMYAISHTSLNDKLIATRPAGFCSAAPKPADWFCPIHKCKVFEEIYALTC